MREKIVPMVVVALALGSAAAAAQDKSARQQGSQPSHAQTSAGTPSAATYSESMRRLREAAQKLRDATHAMADLPAGPRRSEAIRQTTEALAETQSAMLQLPFEAWYANPSAPDYQKSMDRLKQAAQKLRDATHAMAAREASDDINQAIKQTNEALLETQRAMVDLIPDVQASTSGSSTKQQR